MPTIAPQYISQQSINSRPNAPQAQARTLRPSLLSGVPQQQAVREQKIPNISFQKIAPHRNTSMQLAEGAVQLGELYFKHSMDMADRRASVEALEASNTLRTKFRELNSGIAGLKGKEGATAYRDHNEKYTKTQLEIAKGLSGQARVKFLTNTNSYVQSELDTLSKVQLKNMEQWEADTKMNAEQGLAEEVFARRGDLGQVAKYVADGRALYDTAKERYQYQDRMWKHWANAVTEPGKEMQAAQMIRKAMTIPPEQGGMTLEAQNYLNDKLEKIDSAASATFAYTDLLNKHDGDLSAARVEIENPKTWSKYGLDMNEVKNVASLLETTMRRRQSDQERDKKERERLEDGNFYSLMNSGDLPGAMVYANSIEDEKRKAEYIHKINTGQDKTDPTVFSQVSELVRSGDYQEAERKISSARLSGLSNVHADRLLGEVEKKSKTGSLGINQYNNAIDYAKNVLPKHMLGDFELTMRKYMDREKLTEGDPRVYREAKEILRYVSENPNWFTPDTLDIKTDMEMHEELEELSRYAGAKREKRLAKRSTLFEYGLENPDIDIFAIDDAGQIPLDRLPEVQQEETRGEYYDNFMNSVGL